MPNYSLNRFFGSFGKKVSNLFFGYKCMCAACKKKYAKERLQDISGDVLSDSDSFFDDVN